MAGGDESNGAGIDAHDEPRAYVTAAALHARHRRGEQLLNVG